jgi:hypothetical protein
MWAVWGLAAWKWGDWRNWKKYQATILYMMYFSAIYEIYVTTILCASLNMIDLFPFSSIIH